MDTAQQSCEHKWQMADGKWQIHVGRDCIESLWLSWGLSSRHSRLNLVLVIQEVMKLSSMHALSGAALAVLGALMLGGCTTVTETGRSQLNLVSADEEMKLGVTEFQQTKQKTPIRHDAQANALVQRAGQRIAAVANLPNAQ